MVTPPTGSVTVVFAELDGAEELQARSPGPAVEAVGQLVRIVRDRLNARGGYEVKSSGGDFMAAFSSTPDSLRFALEAQEALSAASWPPETGELRLRIGIHVGESIRVTNPLTGTTDYFGPAVNRAARIAAAAHGGQTLLSQPALEAAGTAVVGAVLNDLGEHRLKGLERPEPLYQALPGAHRKRRFPPLRTLTALPTNLPSQTSGFVGREEELRWLAAVFEDGLARVVTLTGPAGVGKTRLAVRAASDLLERFEGGCWFADLSVVADAGGIPAALAAALGVPLAGPEDPAEQVGRALAGRKAVLLILDTFEHLGPGGTRILTQWLERAPEARFLVTSRTPAGVPGERVLRVEPFPVAARPGKAADLDAIRLFVERAREANPAFALTAENERDVVAICAELDGIPLAIELAAARAKVMQPAMMLKKLGQKFQLLRSPRQDASARQQTLSGAIEWSVDLLSAAEKGVLLGLTVFRGGFTPEAARAVVGPGATPEVIEGLRARSLLTQRETPWGPRCAIYRLVHEYAERRRAMETSPEERREAESRHTAFVLEYVEHWIEAMGTSRVREASDRIEAEMENLAAVQERALGRAAGAAADLEIAARAAVAAQTGIAGRGIQSEWSGRLDRVLGAIDASPDAARRMDPSVMGRLLVAVSEGHRLAGDWKAAAEAVDRAIEFASIGPPGAVLAWALRTRGALAGYRGDPDAALADLARAEEISRALKDMPVLALTLNLRGLFERRRGNAEGGLETFREAERVAREADARAALAAITSNLGGTLEMIGRSEEAIDCYERSEQLARELDRPPALAASLASRGAILSRRGDHKAALECFDESERLARECGRVPTLAATLAMRALAHRGAKQWEACLDCFARAEKIFRELGDRALLATLLVQRGQAHCERGVPAEALPGWVEAEELFRAARNPTGAAEAAAMRENLLREMGKSAGGG